MKHPAEAQFIELIAEMGKAYGFDDLAAKIIGILYLEPEPISLEDLAAVSGYSLASISTAMKKMEHYAFIKRIKKPKTRKIYFFMEKDLMKLKKLWLITIAQHEISPAKEKMPGLLAAYKEHCKKTKNNKEKLQIMEQYFAKIQECEHFLDMMKKELGGNT